MTARRRTVTVVAVGSLASLGLAATLLAGVVGPGRGSAGPPYPRHLVFADEFDGPAGAPPDPSVWTVARNADPTDSEKQCYTDSPDNIATDGKGHLVITALKQEGNCSDGWYRYVTSGRMSTQGKKSFEYGRIEVRAKVPAGVGTWPTMWALGDVSDPWPTSGEIDVLETAGRLPDHVIGDIHGPQDDDADQQYFLQAATDTTTPVAEDFHTYGVVWQPDKITWTLDGRAYGSVTRDQADDAGRWVFDHRFYLIVNLAIGGPYGGEVSDRIPYPQRMFVDWIHVYQ